MMESDLNRLFKTVGSQQPTFACPVCGRISYLATDREEGYCAWCHQFTGKRTKKGFTVAVTRDVLAEVNRRIRDTDTLIQSEKAAGRPTGMLELSMASYVGFRADLHEQLREVDEEP